MNKNDRGAQQSWERRGDIIISAEASAGLTAQHTVFWWRKPYGNVEMYYREFTTATATRQTVGKKEGVIKIKNRMTQGVVVQFVLA